MGVRRRRGERPRVASDRSWTEIGMAQDASCALPLTQAQLSDATGLSVVHINRVLKRLRAAMDVA